MIKLSVNETKWSSLLARSSVFFFFIFRFEYLISGPKRYRDFRETGPWALESVINGGIGNDWNPESKFQHGDPHFLFQDFNKDSAYFR